MRKSSLFACLLVAFGTAQAADLVIHEWGTITTIHDAAGKPATGLNRIDEDDVLPSFVHRYEPETTRQPQRQLGKSPLVPGRPDVTMRLETPVIYFHPPPNQKYDNPIDVTVRFRGGVLNEFYPDAEASVALDTPRVHDKMEAGVIKEWNGDVLNNYVVGTLQWKGLRLHDTVVAPLTRSEIWLAPREVSSVSVFSPAAGEGEQYLFYRGVAHLDALLQTKVTRRPGHAACSGAARVARRARHRAEHLARRCARGWIDRLSRTRRPSLCARKKRGRCSHGSSDQGPAITPMPAPRNFAPHSRRRCSRKGLFADEAEAMLNTWKASYFQKAGLRVFYIVPRAWTDYFLPLEFSVPTRVNRVIVGRIDLD